VWFYVLRSVNHPFIYIGHTDNVERRLAEHNEGLNQSAKHYMPFVVQAYVAVASRAKAIELEKYFKTGSGKAILKNRIL
jgi:predicted GIY-YIG superfamily endonuclease